MELLGEFLGKKFFLMFCEKLAIHIVSAWLSNQGLSIGVIITILLLQEENILQAVSDRFDKRLIEEISGIKIQIADLKSEFKAEITSQTNWIVTVMAIGTTNITVVHPVIMKLVERLR